MGVPAEFCLEMYGGVDVGLVIKMLPSESTAIPVLSPATPEPRGNGVPAGVRRKGPAPFGELVT